MASAKNISYSEGDFFAVPLKSGEFGIGIAVCIGPKRTIVARFFSPVRSEIPEIDELEHLTEDDSIHIEHFRDSSLRDGSWKIIGQHPEWDSYEWPIPRFGWLQPNADKSGGRTFEMELDENLKTIRQKEVSMEHFNTLPFEAVVSPKEVEITLMLALTRPGWKRQIPGLS
ncbi:hypothetical protein JYU04_03650 [Dehalococcoides mccartyi]|nr:hypothetical protein [Dehalococcoides mccartyi]